jgi:hypothetical protein
MSDFSDSIVWPPQAGAYRHEIMSLILVYKEREHHGFVFWGGKLDYRGVGTNAVTVLSLLTSRGDFIMQNRNQAERTRIAPPEWALPYRPALPPDGGETK